MKTALKLALGLLLTSLLAGQSLACYTVYNRANQIIYHADAAPIDMRYQIHQTLPAVYPGGHLVFSVSDHSCPPLNQSRANSVQTRVDDLARRNAQAPPAARRSAVAN